jgi:hypothetical protein
MCTDALKRKVFDHLRQRELRAFQQWLRPQLFVQAARRAKVPLGDGPLHLGNLIWLAVGSAFHRGKNFTSILGLCLKLLSDAPGWSSTPVAAAQREGQRLARRQKRHKHDPRGQDPALLTEEAFVQARQKMPWSFWVALLVLLTEAFERSHAERVHWKGFRLLALDGTCINLPRW